MRVKMTLKT